MNTFFSFIIVLSLLVFIHELGHYLIAKFFGIGVEQFSIGMPPRLVGIQIGETEYCISAIPFGGYVKLVGQSDFDKEEEGELGPKDYRGKPTPVKIAVLVAGSLMNIISAIFIFFLLFSTHGVPKSSNFIGSVVEGTMAEKLGLKAGDEIVKINGKDVNRLDRDIVALYTEDNTTLSVKHARGIRTVHIDKKLDQTKDFGILPYYEARVDRTLTDSPAEKAGIEPDDVIIAIDDVAVTGGWYHMSEIIRVNPGSELIFTINRSDSNIQIPITAEHEEEEQPDGTRKTVGKIGIAIRFPTRKAGLAESFTMALGETKFIAVHTVDFFVKLVTGRMSPKLVGGPVMIAKMVGESAKSGLASLFGFTAFISINLGVLNLLPFPVLDGGHIAILLFESVIRRKLSLRFRIALQQAGTIILLLFMIYITFNDFMRFPSISQLFGGN
ncbi:RIP metalloprotease RseP [Candidatus Latescibacterota bacterium]